MMMPMRIAIVALGVVLPAAAFAAHANLPLQQESLQDHMRCDALTQQFDRAAAQHPVADAAKQEAAQGAVLCRAGRFGEGADTLDKAVRMIGESPGK